MDGLFLSTYACLLAIGLDKAPTPTAAVLGGHLLPQTLRGRRSAILTGRAMHLERAVRTGPAAVCKEGRSARRRRRHVAAVLVPEACVALFPERRRRLRERPPPIEMKKRRRRRTSSDATGSRGDRAANIIASHKPASSPECPLRCCVQPSLHAAVDGRGLHCASGLCCKRGLVEGRAQRPGGVRHYLMAVSLLQLVAGVRVDHVAAPQTRNVAVAYQGGRGGSSFPGGDETMQEEGMSE